VLVKIIFFSLLTQFKLQSLIKESSRLADKVWGFLCPQL
jgi:hypothetical protein